MIKIKRGDIVFALFPYIDSDEVKKRPALVIQADSVKTEFDQVVVAQITSRVERAGYPFRVLVKIDDPSSKYTGLRQDSVIMGDKIATIDRSIIYGVAGEMPTMTSVDEALKITLDL